MKAFLSSTYIDLKEHRRAAAEALARLGQEVGQMEVFGARPDEPLTACLSEIEGSDLFIGIYAHRYGFIPIGSSLSITEQEFLHARQYNKPVFAFFVSEDHPWPPKFIEGELAQTKLTEFKQRASNLLISDIFTTPEVLALKVATSVGNYLAKGRIDVLTSQVQAEMRKVGLNPTTLASGRTLSDVPQDARAQLIRKLDDLRGLVDKLAIEPTKSDVVIDPNSILALADGLIAEGNWLAAANEYEKYAKLKPDNWEANYLRAVAYANSRAGYATTIAALRASNETIAFAPADINPNIRARLFVYRAAMLKRLGRLEEAEADLSIAQKHATRKYEIDDINYNFAGVYALQGERSKLLEVIQRLNQSPHYLAAILGHLDDYFQKYKNDEEFRKAIGLVRYIRR